MKDSSIPPPQFSRRFGSLAAALFCLVVVAAACASGAGRTAPGRDGSDTAGAATGQDAERSHAPGRAGADDGGLVAEGQIEGPEAASYPIECRPGAVSVAGPAPVEAIVRRAAELYLASCPEAELTIDRFDDDRGFALLCAGQIDAAGSRRPPTADELSDCADNGIRPVALPLATEALVVVAGDDGALVECLAFADLYALLGADSVGFSRWDDADELGSEAGSTLGGYPDAALDVFAPADADADRLGFEEMVLAPVAAALDTESTVRSDLVGVREIGELIDGLASSTSGIGWMSFDLATANASSLTPIALRTSADTGCVHATDATVADGSYPAARRLDLHVAVRTGGAADDASKPASRPPVEAFVRYLYGDTYPVVVGAANGATGYLALPEGERRLALDAWADQ